MPVKRISQNELDDTQRTLISDFIKENDGLVFHEIAFNEILASSFSTQFSYLLLFDKMDELTAVCPVHTVKSGIFLNAYSNPTHYQVPYGGWIYKKSKTSFEDLLSITPVRYNESLDIWTSPFHSITAPKKNFQQFKTLIIDLSVSEEEIWNNYIHSKRRNMIRKAHKVGVKVNHNMSFFDLYPLLHILYKKLGKSLHSYEYYGDIIDHYSGKNEANVLLAMKGNKIMAGMVALGNANVVHYWLGASTSGSDNIGQGELLQWEAIKWSKRTGKKFYDLCVIEEERLPHIARFKAGFSNKEMSFYFLRKNTIGYKVLRKFFKLFSSK